MKSGRGWLFSHLNRGLAYWELRCGWIGLAVSTLSTSAPEQAYPTLLSYSPYRPSDPKPGPKATCSSLLHWPATPSRYGGIVQLRAIGISRDSNHSIELELGGQ